MAELAGFEIPIEIPSFGIGTGKLWIIIVLFMFAITTSIIVYVIYLWRTYNKRIIVFENISGQGFQPVHKDRARLIALGDGGEEILFLRKKKVYRTAYGKKMGKNTYWFAVGQDGYWYNIILGDVDAKMGMLDIEPIDRDMRYMHVAIRKNIQDRYRKTKWMEKYGQMVISLIALLIMFGGIWFLMDKLADISGSVAGAVETSVKVQQETNKIISILDNICSRSGIS